MHYMNANDEAPSNLEQASMEKAEKNETEIAENDTAEPAANATNDTNDTADAKAEGRLLFSSSLFSRVFIFPFVTCRERYTPHRSATDAPRTFHAHQGNGEGCYRHASHVYDLWEGTGGSGMHAEEGLV